MNLSEHFTLEEMIASTAARGTIDNTPTPEIVENLRFLCARLEEVRILLGQSMIISSGYRCPALNEKVGGAPKSQHMLGLAADFICPAAGTPLSICRKVDASAIRFDQLIYEYTWCHVSFVRANPRRETLTLNASTHGYLSGIQG